MSARFDNAQLDPSVAVQNHIAHLVIVLLKGRLSLLVVDVSDELHVIQLLRLTVRRRSHRLLNVLRAAYLLLRPGAGGSVGLEDEVGFEDGLGLGGGDAGEDVEELGVAEGRDLAVEEEFVHFFGGGRGGGGWEGGDGVVMVWTFLRCCV